jgi:threonylcarbamoyladenosine tRNA methylthiotransferase MtaB
MAGFAVRFLGCKVSQADVTLIRDALLDAGHSEVAPDRAEVHVVNTCALTLEAERKSRQQVNRASRRADLTFVTGCAVNLNAEQFGADSGVVVVPRSADRAAAEIVERLGSLPGPGCRDDSPRSGRTRAFLKVQNGCDSRCAFCIIPTTRGGAESRPLGAILRDARRRLDEGNPELVLTGINIGTWTDPDRGWTLSHLVRALASLDGVERLRISSIEPGSVNAELIESIAETACVGTHLHIPLQSGSLKVLRAMRRSYSPEAFLEACVAARSAIPGLNTTTDAIVGFPGEDAEAFQETLDVVEEAGISKVHVFPFSARPGTEAERLSDAVSADERADRSRCLRDLSDRLGAEYRRGRVGSRDVVLVEKRLDDGGLTGLGADYSRMVLPVGRFAPGDMVAVDVVAVSGDHLVGAPRP